MPSPWWPPPLWIFLDLLEHVPPDETWVILSLPDLPALKSAIESAVGFAFREPVNRAGHNMHNVRSGTQRGYDNLRITINLCKRGGVPKDSHYFEELKDFLPGTAMRHPGYPPEACFATANKNWNDVLVACMESLGIDHHPMTISP